MKLKKGAMLTVAHPVRWDGNVGVPTGRDDYTVGRVVCDDSSHTLAVWDDTGRHVGTWPTAWFGVFTSNWFIVKEQ